MEPQTEQEIRDTLKVARGCLNGLRNVFDKITYAMDQAMPMLEKLRTEFERQEKEDGRRKQPIYDRAIRQSTHGQKF